MEGNLGGNKRGPTMLCLNDDVTFVGGGHLRALTNQIRVICPTNQRLTNFLKVIPSIIYSALQWSFINSHFYDPVLYFLFYISFLFYICIGHFGIGKYYIEFVSL